jgi:hypothetical protein
MMVSKIMKIFLCGFGITNTIPAKWRYCILRILGIKERNMSDDYTMGEDGFPDDDQEDEREASATCDNCGKNLYEGDRVWGNNQFGTYCEECAEEEIAFWWDTI